MGRKRNFYLREYFVEKDGQAECKSCGQKVSNFLTNLKRHLQKNHSDILQDFSKKNKKDESAKEEHKQKITIEISKEEVTNSCIEFITKESLPLSFLDSKPFKTLTGQLFDGLQFQINSRNIMDIISEKSIQIKEKIKAVLKNKIFCLKMDTATRNDRGILGINVQLISNGQIKIFSLAMLELKKKHTAEYLKEEIEKILKDYQISKNQIYAVTTDNGRNMIKAVELLGSESEEFLEDMDDEAFDEIIYNINFENILSIKCAAHTLQLAVKDFLKDFSDEIEKARKIVKTLRCPSFR